jgi:hypothetical protein
MNVLQRLIDNPVALIGVLRALALFLAAQGIGWFSDDANVEGAMNLISVLFPFIALLFTGASAKAADSETRAAYYTIPDEYRSDLG